MGTFQKEKCCKKWRKIDFRHHFMLHYNPKFVVISQTNWFSEKFRKERLCCLVLSWILSFNSSCDRNESYEILAFIYFRTSLTFLNFGQQLLTIFKKSKHGRILEFFKFSVLETVFNHVLCLGRGFDGLLVFPLFLVFYSISYDLGTYCPDPSIKTCM